MEGLYHQVHQFPFITEPVVVVEASDHSPASSNTVSSYTDDGGGGVDTVMAVRRNHPDGDDPSQYYSSTAYEPIRATIELNVLVCQIVTIPIVAQAA